MPFIFARILFSYFRVPSMAHENQYASIDPQKGLVEYYEN